MNKCDKNGSRIGHWDYDCPISGFHLKGFFINGKPNGTIVLKRRDLIKRIVYGDSMEIIWECRMDNNLTLYSKGTFKHVEDYD